MDTLYALKEDGSVDTIGPGTPCPYTNLIKIEAYMGIVFGITDQNELVYWLSLDSDTPPDQTILDNIESGLSGLTRTGIVDIIITPSPLVAFIRADGVAELFFDGHVATFGTDVKKIDIVNDRMVVLTNSGRLSNHFLQYGMEDFTISDNTMVEQHTVNPFDPNHALSAVDVIQFERAVFALMEDGSVYRYGEHDPEGGDTEILEDPSVPGYTIKKFDRAISFNTSKILNIVHYNEPNAVPLYLDMNNNKFEPISIDFPKAGWANWNGLDHITCVDEDEVALADGYLTYGKINFLSY